MSKKTVFETNSLLVKERLAAGASFVMRWGWGTSRGCDTYGYTICTCYMGDYKVGRTMGGGYDMKGASIAAFINAAFKAELEALDATGLPGLYKRGEYVFVEGATGYDNMINIIRALGFDVDYLYMGGNEGAYRITTKA